MKPALVLLLVSVTCLAACSDAPPPPPATAATATDASEAGRLVGAWELLRGEYPGPDGAAGSDRFAGQPYQLRLFTDSHFAYAMRDEAGRFTEASAGTYIVSGDTYTETHHYHSGESVNRFSADWRYRISGDTLYTEMTKVVDSSGEDVTGQYGTWREVRVRAE